MSVAHYIDRDTVIDGLKLHYQEWGDPASPPILMIHGFGVSGHMFDEFADRMQATHRLIALDQRGHGDSDWAPTGDYSRSAFVGDIESFRQSLPEYVAWQQSNTPKAHASLSWVGPTSDNCWSCGIVLNHPHG